MAAQCIGVTLLYVQCELKTAHFELGEEHCWPLLSGLFADITVERKKRSKLDGCNFFAAAVREINSWPEFRRVYQKSSMVLAKS
uniref:Uncharacterized protein n=1 Tax=Strigamia maritima TaxID=126957 RepID=T1J1D2_STRMM